jgi:F0F1-type ATP synthase assembly protein I
MKLLNRQTRVNTEDPLGRGLDAVIVIVLFFGAGFGLDRFFGTTPIFMIAFTLLGAFGLFVKFKYAYEARMLEHEAERNARRAPAPAPPDATPRGRSEVA